MASKCRNNNRGSGGRSETITVQYSYFRKYGIAELSSQSLFKVSLYLNEDGAERYEESTALMNMNIHPP